MTHTNDKSQFARNLAGAMLKLPNMMNPQHRQTLIRELDHDIGGAIINAHDTRSHVLHIVYACLDFKNGVANLRTVLDFFYHDIEEYPKVKALLDEFDGGQHTVLHQLPRLEPDYIDYKDSMLDNHISDDCRIVGVFGMPGSGKTQMLLRLASSLQKENRFPDGELYLDLFGHTKSPLTQHDIMIHIIKSFQEHAKFPEADSSQAGLSFLRARYRNILFDKRIILFFDNVHNREQISDLIPSGTCITLIASRQIFMLPGLFLVKTKPMPQDVAVRMLTTIAPHVGEGEGASKLVELCGCLPMQIRLTGDALRINCLKPAEYIARLEGLRQRGSSVPQELQDLQSSIRLSYELLRDPLKEPVQAVSIFEGSFDIAAVMAVLLEKADFVREILDELQRHSLISYLAELDRYEMHDLVRLTIYGYLSTDKQKTFGGRHFDFYLGLALEAKPHLRRSHQLASLLRLDIEERNLATSLEYAETAKEAAKGLELAAALCHFYLIRGKARTIQACLDKFLAGVAASSENQQARAYGLLMSGHASYSLGDYELAFQKYTASRKLMNRHDATPDRAILAGALGNIALFAKCDYRAATRLYRAALAIEMKSGRRWTVGLFLKNIGTVLVVQNRLNESLNYFQRALEEEEADGSESERLITTFKIIGVLIDLGKRNHAQIERAEHLCADAGLRAARIAFEPGIAHFQYYSACIEQFRQNYQKAEVLLTQARSAYEELGLRFAETETRRKLAQCFEESGDFERACQEYETYIDTSQHIAQNRDRVLVALRLGEVHRLRRQQPIKAELAYLRALEMNGTESDTTGKIILCNLAMTAYDPGPPSASALTRVLGIQPVSRRWMPPIILPQMWRSFPTALKYAQ